MLQHLCHRKQEQIVPFVSLKKDKKILLINDTKKEAIYVSWESFATKGIISDKRPKTDVSLKERRKKLKLTTTRMFSRMKVQQRRMFSRMVW